MGDFLHRTTKVLLLSHSPNRLPETLANYISQPDLSAVVGVESEYWNIVGDVVSEMSASEKATVDAAEASALVTANRAEAVAVPDKTTLPAGTEMRALIELLNKRDNYLTNRISELQDALDDVKATTGGADNIRAAIPATWLATATRTRADAITDYKDDITAGNADT